MTGISSAANPTSDFNGVSTLADDIKHTVVPGIKGAFSYASEGIGSFMEDNPGMAKWGALGVALLAGPTLFSMVKNGLSNPGAFALDAGKMLGMAAIGITLASAVGDWASNRDQGLGFGDALANAIEDTAGLAGSVASDVGDGIVSMFPDSPGM